MTEQEFITKFGEESQEVTKNYATKSLGTNYDIKDAFIEFGDNAYDARLKNVELTFNIITDDDKHMFIFTDNGSGISDASNLFKLGGTNKENNKNRIGKYGIGVPGAASAIATQCRFNKTEPVEVIFESACKGKYFEKHAIITPGGDLIIGKTLYSEQNETDHWTKITFTNVILNDPSYIVDSMDETFEIPIHKDFNICFNGRTLGKSGGHKTFMGDEGVKKIMVGEYEVDVKYRILGEADTTKDARLFNEAGLRVYDKTSGRLLAKSNQLWSWYGDKEPQQTICGLRAAIFIESSIDSYNKFGIKPAKNGVTYKKYCKTDPDFKDLSDYLKIVYNQGASVNAPSHKNEHISFDGREFIPTTAKMTTTYASLPQNPNVFIFKQKPTKEEIARLINTIIDLQNKLDRKNSKTKKVEA